MNYYDVMSPESRTDAVIQSVRNQVRAAGLHTFEEQAINAATNSLKSDPTSEHRAIRRGVQCAHEYEIMYLGS